MTDITPYHLCVNTSLMVFIVDLILYQDLIIVNHLPKYLCGDSNLYGVRCKIVFVLQCFLHKFEFMIFKKQKFYLPYSFCEVFHFYNNYVHVNDIISVWCSPDGFRSSLHALPRCTACHCICWSNYSSQLFSISCELIYHSYYFYNIMNGIYCRQQIWIQWCTYYTKHTVDLVIFARF